MEYITLIIYEIIPVSSKVYPDEITEERKI